MRIAAADREPSATHAGRHALGLTVLAYLPAVLSMMTVGVIVPFIDIIGRDLAARPAELGLSIAIFSLPAAILATVGGGLIDKYGVRRAMLAEVLASAAGSLLASRAHSLWSMDGAMVIGGLGFGGLCVTAPCLLVATLQNGVRVRSLSFLSTYAPTGYAAGLLLAAACAGGGWRLGLSIHAALLAATFVLLWAFVPKMADDAGRGRESLRHTFARIGLVIREPRALRLGLAVSLPNAISYGTSIVAPSYLARVHHLSLANSSATVAGAKITAMVIGGLSMGYLLSRKVSTALLFGIMAAIGLSAQVVLFLPASGMIWAMVALIVWIFAFGGMSGGCMTLLPNVAGDRSRVGAASGLMNQFISVASFATPSTWLSLHTGGQYICLAAVCLLISCVALPASKSVSSSGDSGR